MLVGRVGVGLFKAISPLNHIAANNKFDTPGLHPSICVSAKDVNCLNYRIRLIAGCNGVTAGNSGQADLISQLWKTISGVMTKVLLLKQNFSRTAEPSFLTRSSK